MHFSDYDLSGTPAPKILGTYEKEIQEELSRWTERKFNRLINVGGAEGFYAVGIMKTLDVDEAIVYEKLEEGRNMIHAISENNRVSQYINIFSCCEESDLYEICDESLCDLVFMDVEGAEVELLSSRVIAKLRNSAVVVEAHDFCVNNCTNLVRDRLHRTHATKILTSRERVAKDFPLSFPLPKAIKFAMMDERRPEVMNWIIANPRIATSNRRTFEDVHTKDL